MFNVWLLRWTLACCAVGLSMSATAADVQQYCSRPMRVALFEFGVMYRSATGDGIDARLVDALSKRTGCTFVQVVLPRNRIWNELQNGSLDFATAAIPTPERKVYGYLLPYLKTRNLVLMRSATAAQATTMTEFEASTLRMGVVRGFRHEEVYDQMIARLAAQQKVVEASDVADDLRLLERGVVDAILSQPIVFRQYLDAQRIQNELVLRDWAPKEQYSLGALILSKKSFTQDQARRWDALLVAMQRDGTLLKINREFLPADQARDLVYTGPRSPD